MKKVLAVLVVILVLWAIGSEEGPEKRKCYHCGEAVERWVDSSDGESLCARCFSEDGYLVCVECSDAYKPGWADDADGYCSRCAEHNTWYCSFCEERQALDDLAEVDAGYFLCAWCVYRQAQPFDNAFAETYVDYVSPFNLSETSLYESRNDALGLIAEDLEEDTAGSVFSEPEYYFLDYDDGYSEGYAEGQRAGYAEGFQAGETSGKDKAYNEGYTAGYQAGKAEAAKATLAVTPSGNKDNSSSSSTTQNVEITVYITRTGEKYHRSGCQYLRQSKIAIGLNAARAQGYGACSRCW